MDMQAKFYQELLPDERILWTGQPDTTIIFTEGDIYTVPFSLLWVGAVLFGLLPNFFKNEITFPSALFPLFFVAVGAYMLFGRFIYKYLKKKQTYYAVTNYRALIVSEFLRKSFQAINYKTVSSITKTLNTRNRGTIIFGLPEKDVMSSNMGTNIFNDTNVPAFFDIHQVDEVYKLFGRRKS